MRPQLGKDKILQAAIQLFSKTGFHGTSISQIAKAADVSKGLMYIYFKSKEDLLLAMIEQANEGMFEVAGALSAPSNCSLEEYQKLLQQFLGQFAGLLGANSEYLSFQLSLLYQPDLKPLVAGPLQKRAAHLLAVTEGIFRNAYVAKPQLTARRFMSELDGIALHHLSVFEDYPLTEMLEQMFQHYKDLPNG